MLDRVTWTKTLTYTRNERMDILLLVISVLQSKVVEPVAKRFASSGILNL